MCVGFHFNTGILPFPTNPFHTQLNTILTHCLVRVSCICRSELLTEVVKDVEVMPADPSECLPLAQLHVPLLLNGRPTAPTTAAAAAAASLARRRQQQQAAAAAAAAQQQQAQLLAAAAAAQATAVRQEEFKADMGDLTGEFARSPCVQAVLGNELHLPGDMC